MHHNSYRGQMNETCGPPPLGKIIPNAMTGGEYKRENPHYENPFATLGIEDVEIKKGKSQHSQEDPQDSEHQEKSENMSTIRMSKLQDAPTFQLVMKIQGLEDEQGLESPRESMYPLENPISNKDKLEIEVECEVVQTKSTRKVDRKYNKEVQQEQAKREREKGTQGVINNSSFKIIKNQKKNGPTISSLDGGSKTNSK